MEKQHKISCYSLILEITRRCNMACSHCMRGNAENIDMNRTIIEQVFSQVSNIDVLTFSGGEPSLCPDNILFALECVKKYGIYVGYVYIVTNGKEVSDAFLQACREWHVYCMGCKIKTNGLIGFRDAKYVINELHSESDIMGCIVALSMDPYHEYIPTDNLIRLSSLPILVTDKYEEFELDKEILDEGRAKENGIGDQKYTAARKYAYGKDANILYFDNISEDGLCVFVDELYINAEGGILKYCDYSYKSQEDHILGHVSDTWVKDLINKFSN